MKKKYQAPEIKIVNVKSNTLLSGSTVKSFGGNVFEGSPQASNGFVSARSRSFDDDWDDEE